MACENICRPLDLPGGGVVVSPYSITLQWEVGLTAARTCFSPPTSNLHSAPNPRHMKHKSQGTVPMLWGAQGSPQHLLHTPLAVWAQLATRSTHAWVGGACSVAFTPVKIEYMQAICTMELHAMKFLIVCTLVWIWHYVACTKEWKGLGLSPSHLSRSLGARRHPPRFCGAGVAPDLNCPVSPFPHHAPTSADCSPVSENGNVVMVTVLAVIPSGFEVSPKPSSGVPYLKKKIKKKRHVCTCVLCLSRKLWVP